MTESLAVESVDLQHQKLLLIDTKNTVKFDTLLFTENECFQSETQVQTVLSRPMLLLHYWSSRHLI